MIAMFQGMQLSLQLIIQSSGIYLSSDANIVMFPSWRKEGKMFYVLLWHTNAYSGP